jgi:NitT/TauT family transport system permease protein
MAQLDIDAGVFTERPATVRRGRLTADRLWLPLSALLLIGLWEGLIRAFSIPSVLLPSPLSALAALWRGLAAWGPASLWPHLWATLQEIVVGFAAGALLGLALGIVVALSPLAQRILRPYVLMFQAIPKVAIAPLFVVWLGFGIASKIALSVVVVFFPVFVNTVSGIRSVPAPLLDLMASLGATRRQTLTTAILPSALPFVFAGLEIAAVYSVIAAIVSEFVGGQRGLGVLLLQRNNTLDLAGVFAILLVLGVLGVGLSKLIEAARRRIVFWERS